MPYLAVIVDSVKSPRHTVCGTTVYSGVNLMSLYAACMDEAQNTLSKISISWVAADIPM